MTAKTVEKEKTITKKNNNKIIHNNETAFNEPEESGAPLDLKSYLDNLDSEKTFNVRLYRKIPRAGKSKSVFISEYNDELPSYTEVGELYGSGDYEFIIRIFYGEEKPELKTNKFTLDERFDAIANERAEQSALTVQETATQAATVAPSQSLDNAFSLIEKVFSLMAPMMKQQEQTNPIEQMASITAMANKMMENSFNQQSKMQTEYFKQLKDKNEEIIEMQSQVVEPEEKEEDITEKILSMVEKYLPLIKNLGMSQLKTMAEPLTQSNELQYIMQNQKRIDNFVSALNKKFAKKTVEKILGIFNSTGGQVQKKAASKG